MRKSEKVGVIAGRGNIPRLLRLYLSKKKIPYFFLGLKSIADPKVCDLMLSVGQLGTAIRTLKKEKIDKLVFIGGLDRPALDEIKPDLGGWLFLLRNALKVKGDNSLLTALAGAFEGKGIKVVGVHEIMPDLLVKQKVYTKKKPSAKDKKAIQHGVDLAKKLGEMDVGQSVVVQGNLCLGLEGIEGTEALIKRCGTLKRGTKTKPILVKMCKPTQDKRLDMPTIGLGTIQQAIKAGYAGVAVEAGAVLFPDAEKAIAKANDAGLFIQGI